MEKRDYPNREVPGRDEPSRGPLPSETVRDAHAAGDGALERSDSEDPASRAEDPRTGETDDTTRY